MPSPIVVFLPTPASVAYRRRSRPASALATLAALHEERAVLDYDVQFLDFRNDGEMVIRPWPDRAATAGRGA